MGASEAVKYYRDTSEPLRYYRKNHSFKHSTEHQKCNFFKLCRDTHLRWPKMLKHMIGDMFLQKSEVNMLADHQKRQNVKFSSTFMEPYLYFWKSFVFSSKFILFQTFPSDINAVQTPQCAHATALAGILSICFYFHILPTGQHETTKYQQQTNEIYVLFTGQSGK